MGYLLSRVEQPASDILEPYLESTTSPLVLTSQIFGILEQVYGTPNKEASYMVKFEALLQGATDFGHFVAEFHRLAAPLRRDSDSLAMDFRRKVHPSIRRHLLGRSLDPHSLTDLIAACRDINNNMQLDRQMAQLPAAGRNPQPATRPLPDRQTSQVRPLPSQASKSPRMRTATTHAERVQLGAEGRCYQCRQQGHRAFECPLAPASASTMAPVSVLASSCPPLPTPPASLLPCDSASQAGNDMPLP